MKGGQIMSNSIKLSPLLTDGVVLQREKNVRLWGHVNPGDSIRVEIDKREVESFADDSGKFQLVLPKHAAGGPYTLTVKSDDSEVKVKDVYYGDVWLLAGQSNMQLPISRLAELYPDEIKKAKDQLIHYFKVPEHYQFNSPADELAGGNWESATGEKIATMSGIGYFFAQQMRKQKKVPIGLVQSAVGGTPLRCWLSEDDLAQLKELPVDFQALKDEQLMKQFTDESARYQHQYNEDRDHIDRGLQEDWVHQELDNSWQPVDIGQPIAKSLMTSGSVWFKGQINVPAKLVGQSAMMRLGTVIDSDQTYVNGEKVGEIGYQYPPRNYTIEKLPAKLDITLRLKIDQKTGGWRKDKRHVIEAAGEVIDLNKGQWFMKRGCSMPSRKQWFFPQYLPVGLYNGEIYPLRNFCFKGILWYQGESDSHNPVNYGKVFTHLIQSWRQLFKRPDMPFLFVQLPNCGIEPNHDWAAVRGQQAQAMFLHHTAMAVALGYGEDNDLHPLNKKAVVAQLMKLTHRMQKYPDGCASGPVALRAANDNGQIVIEFQTYDRHLNAEAGNAFVLETNGERFLLDDYQVQADSIVINLPRRARIGPDSHIAYAWSNTPTLFVTDKDGSAAAPFKLVIRPEYHVSSVFTHVLSKM